MSSKSAIIYLTCFFFSLLFVMLAEIEFKTADKGKKRTKLIGICFSIIALLIPCILAMVRDVTVGVDIGVYVTPNLMTVNQASSFLDYYKNMPNQTEILFAVLLYYIGKYGTIHILFFTIEALIIVPVYVILYLRRREGSITLGMLVFYLLFYNISLCVMRAMIAQGFLLMSYYFYTSKKRRWSLFYLFIAVLFHNSTVIPLLFLCIIILINNSSKKKQYYLVLTASLILFFLLYRKIIAFFIPVIGFISQRYAFYINYYLNVNSGFDFSDVSYFDLLSKSLLIVFTYISSKLVGEKGKHDILALTLIGRYFSLFSANFHESLRIAFFFDYYLIYYVSEIYKYYKKNSFNKIAIGTIIVVILFAYWYFMFIDRDAFKTSNFIFNL